MVTSRVPVGDDSGGPLEGSSGTVAVLNVL